MGRSKKVEVEEVVEVVEVQNSDNVTQNLEVDPNDPRNVKPAESGFSLNDE